MPALWRVHWLQVVGLFGASGPAKRLALVLWSCVPSFLSALSLCLWCVVLEYALISRFKGVFSGFLGLLCGFVLFWCFAWLVGLCTRVELGGLKA